MTSDLMLPLGMTDENDLVVNPYPNLSRLVIGSTGAAKTTTVVMTTIQSLMASTAICVFVNDPKDGECFSQLVSVYLKYEMRFGCIDDLGHFGWDNPYRLALNPFNAIISAAKHNPDKLIFTIITTTHYIIAEVNDGGRNFVFREYPRQEIHLAILILLEFMPNDVRPGVLYEMMSDPYTWQQARENAAIEGSPALKARAQLSLNIEDKTRRVISSISEPL